MPVRELVLFLALSCAGALPGHADAGQAPAPPGLAALVDRVLAVQQKFKDLHPAFARAYPVAVVVDKTFYVYEHDAAAGGYKLAATAPDKMGIQKGIRAAMPLDFWGSRMACVVTPDAFDDLQELAVVLHEFVHCYQWETCEIRLKEKMSVYRSAMERKDYMWELQYAFPYVAESFAGPYSGMLAALEAGSAANLGELRSRLKKALSPEDWEYMTWEEWKEGLARFLENQLRDRLGRPANRRGATPPFSRVTFYAGGEALIRALSRRDPRLEKDVERLYHAIAER